MYLTHQEREKLLLLTAASVAERRKQKGLKLNYPEAVAYLSGYIIEGAREGKTVKELIERCTQLLSAHDVMNGVPELLQDLQVEATFPDGTKLVSIHHPISGTDDKKNEPGQYVFAEGDILLSENRSRQRIKVINTGDRPVQVGLIIIFMRLIQRFTLIGMRRWVTIWISHRVCRFGLCQK